MLQIALVINLSLYVYSKEIALGANVSTYRNFIGDQKRLLDHLFDKYNPQMSMIYTLHDRNGSNTPVPFPIEVTIQFFTLIKVVVPEEKITFIIDYTMVWNDYRLAWDPKEYGNITHFYIPIEKLWIPQFYIISIQGLEGYRPDYSKIAKLSYKGDVLLYTDQVASVICTMNISQFPFDTQICRIEFTSLLYQVNEYQIKLNNYPWWLQSQELGNGEWKVLNITSESFREHSDLDFTGDIYWNTYVLKMKRNSSFYTSMIIIPYFVINILSILGMFLTRADKMGKLTIALTNLMSTTFILGILEDSVPKTRNLSLLSIYVLVNLGIIMVAVVTTIIIPIAYGKYKRNILRIGKVSPTNKELPAVDDGSTTSASQGFVRSFFWDKQNWNRALLILLQAANVGNLVYIFVA